MLRQTIEDALDDVEDTWLVNMDCREYPCIVVVESEFLDLDMKSAALAEVPELEDALPSVQKKIFLGADHVLTAFALHNAQLGPTVQDRVSERIDAIEGVVSAPNGR